MFCSCSVSSLVVSDVSCCVHKTQCDNTVLPFALLPLLLDMPQACGTSRTSFVLVPAAAAQGAGVTVRVNDCAQHKHSYH